LLAAADNFNRLAPWVWMHDSQVIGLRFPRTNEVLLGSILGRMRSMFALLVYRNDAGHRWLLSTILNDGDSGGLDGEDNAFEQDLVKVEFVLKRELTKPRSRGADGCQLFSIDQERAPLAAISERHARDFSVASDTE
jgi:hypothetical protein